jgi:hypothetical protein
MNTFTDHKNHMRDALVSTLDRVHQWRILLEEFGPKIVFIKGIHNTIADAISRVEYDPSVNQIAESYFMTKFTKNSKRGQRQNWTAVSKHRCELDLDTNKHEDLSLVFANQREDNDIYPRIAIEMIYYKQNANTPENDMLFQLSEDTKVLYKDDKLIIPASLWHRAVSWYHHYLQHPGHSHLEETMRSVMYWKGMHNTIWSYIKSYRSCQIKKKHSQKYGHVPSKLVIMTPWQALCVDLIGSYTLKGKDGTSVDLMCLTIIDLATSLFVIVELTTVIKLTVPNICKGKKVACNNYTK